MSTPFQLKLAAQAQKQFDKYSLLRENQAPLSGQIASYWQDLGLQFPGVATPWSAVFVSWCVLKSGAEPGQFQYSARHAKFVQAAIANFRAGTGVFHGRDPADHAPKVGDILQNNRSGNQFDYAYAASHGNYPSHSAIVMEVGVDTRGRYLRTIGGNESDAVGLKEVRLDGSGRVRNSDGLYISVIETLL